MENEDKLKGFMTALGLVVELWMATYGAFITRGLPHEEAIEHTKALISVYISTALDSDKNKEK